MFRVTPLYVYVFLNLCCGRSATASWFLLGYAIVYTQNTRLNGDAAHLQLVAVRQLLLHREARLVIREFARAGACKSTSRSSGPLGPFHCPGPFGPCCPTFVWTLRLAFEWACSSLSVGVLCNPLDLPRKSGGDDIARAPRKRALSSIARLPKPTRLCSARKI